MSAEPSSPAPVSELPSAPQSAPSNEDLEAARQAAVRLRVHYNDDSTPAIEVPLRRSAFSLRDGRPSGLRGPHVRIDLDAPISRGALPGDPEGRPIETPNRVAPAAPDPQGGFTGANIDLAQTTPFFAANQVHDLVVRSAGRPLRWGEDGVLAVRPYASVGATTFAVNAESELTAGGRVAFHAWGSVRDGRFVGFDGRFPELDALSAQLRQQADEAARAGRGAMRFAPYFRERERQLRGAMKHVEAAVRDRDDGRKAQRALAAALRALGLPAEGATPAAPPSQAQRGASCPPRMEGPDDMPEPPLDRRLRRAPRHVQEAARNIERLRMGAAGAVSQVADAYASLKLRRGGTLNLALSREVSAHEAGHAALGALKPYLFQTFTGAALHEGYGDVMSVLTAFDHDDTVASVLRETGGDLRRSSSVTRISERFQAVLRQTQRTGPPPKVTRDVAEVVRLRSLGGFGHADKQPRAGRCGPADISQHRAGQAFSGIVYGVFAQAATDAAAQGGSEAEKVARVRAVRDEVSAVLHRALLFLPEGGGTPADFARAMLEADRRAGGRYADAIRREARARDVLPAGVDERLPNMSRLPAINVPATLRGEALGRELTTGRLGRTLSRPFDQLRRSLQQARRSPQGQFLGAVGEPRVKEDVVDAQGYRLVRITAAVKLEDVPPDAPSSVDVPVLSLVLDPRGRPVTYDGPGGPEVFTSGLPGLVPTWMSHGGGRCSCH